MDVQRHVRPQQHPVDRGWAWVVMLASLGSALLDGALVYSVGVLHVGLLDRFRQDSVTVVALTGAVNGALMSAAAPIGGYIINRHGCRTCCVLGGLFCFTGYTSSAFVTSVTLLFFTYGVTAGLGLGLTHSANNVTMGFYFDKHRGLASGISNSASGVGILAGSMIIQALVETYGVGGTFLLLGGVGLHFCFFGMFYRPTIYEGKSLQIIRKQQTSLLDGVEILPDLDQSSDANEHEVPNTCKRDEVLEISFTGDPLLREEQPSSERVEILPDLDKSLNPTEPTLSRNAYQHDEVLDIGYTKEEKEQEGEESGSLLIGSGESRGEVYGDVTSGMSRKPTTGCDVISSVKTVESVTSSVVNLKEGTEKSSTFESLLSFATVPASGTSEKDLLLDSSPEVITKEEQLCDKTSQNQVDASLPETAAELPRSKSFGKTSDTADFTRGKSMEPERECPPPYASLVCQQQTAFENSDNTTEQEGFSEFHSVDPLTKQPGFLSNDYTTSKQAALIISSDCSAKLPGIAISNDCSTNHVEYSDCPTRQPGLVMSDESSTKRPGLLTSSGYASKQEPLWASLISLSPQPIKDRNENTTRRSIKGQRQNLGVPWYGSYVALLTDTAFMLHCVSLFVANVHVAGVFLHLPEYVQHHGASFVQAAELLLVVGCTSLVSKLSCAFAVSDPEIEPLILSVGMMGLNGVATCLFPLYVDAFSKQVVFAALFGLYSGGAYALINPILVRFAGVSRLADAYGISMFLQGVGYLMGPIFAAMIVDAGGTYGHSFLFLGLMMLSGSVLDMAAAGFLQSRDKRGARGRLESDWSTVEGGVTKA